MRVRFMQRAPQGSVWHRAAFAAAIGQTTTITIGGAEFGRGTLLTAEVSDDGQWVELEIEVTDGP